jgi:hypothetical protein
MTPSVATGLLRIPLVLSGAWASASRELWIARASCQQAVVCISFQVCDGVGHWAKSSRLAADMEAIRISLGVNPADAADVTIACGWIAQPVRLAEAGARPVLPEKIVSETGVLWPLCRFDARPAIDLYLLFLASADVSWGRNRLWRLHPSRASGVCESYRTVLAAGRSGTCMWPLAGLVN